MDGRFSRAAEVQGEVGLTPGYHREKKEEKLVLLIVGSLLNNIYSTTHALLHLCRPTFINPRPSLRHTSKIQCGPIASFCGTAVSGIQNLHRSKKHCYPPTSTCEVSASIQTIRLAHIAIDCCLNLKVVRLMPP
jgi:hypothetical protein